MQSQILVVVIMLIAAAVFVVAIFKRLNLSPVLGYLVAGAMIGDHGMKVVTYEKVYIWDLSPTALAEFCILIRLQQFRISHLACSLEKRRSILTILHHESPPSQS